MAEPAAALHVDLSNEPDRVQQQLIALGPCHIGYGHLQLPDIKISVVGARPFSKVMLTTDAERSIRLYQQQTS